jgi:transcriptional regulator with XRE-family HTH domain
MKVHNVMAGRFRKRLSEQRVLAGLSQDQLGKALGVSGVYVLYLERGDRSPSMEMIEKCARYFKLDPSRMVAP